MLLKVFGENNEELIQYKKFIITTANRDLQFLADITYFMYLSTIAIM